MPRTPPPGWPSVGSRRPTPEYSLPPDRRRALLDPNAPSLGQTFGSPALFTSFHRSGSPTRASSATRSTRRPHRRVSPPLRRTSDKALPHRARFTDGTAPAPSLRSPASPPCSRGTRCRTSTVSEWYFPQRLTDDTGAVANGNANPAQSVLDVDATMGHDLPKNLLIYAFGAHLGGAGVPAAAQLLAAQSGIPMSNLTLANYQSTYSHNDPAGAYPTTPSSTGSFRSWARSPPNGNRPIRSPAPRVAGMTTGSNLGWQVGMQA